jgi:predicted dehydrogenase
MTKCCHDLDLLCHWFSSANPPVKVSSFGSLQHFKRAAKPVEAGNATRCNACPLERTCAYSATRIYLDPVTRGERGWPAATIVDGVPDIENIGAALADGPYGACVYEAPNDVCDNQVVNLQFADGQTAAFTMAAQTALICERQTRMHFAFGEVIGDGTQLVVNDFRTRTSRTLRPPRAGSSGHGDGDLGLMGAFVRAVRAGDQTALGTNADEVLRAHMTVFAAEASRREGRVVDCAEFEREWREKLSIEV